MESPIHKRLKDEKANRPRTHDKATFVGFWRGKDGCMYGAGGWFGQSRRGERNRRWNRTHRVRTYRNEGGVAARQTGA